MAVVEQDVVFTTKDVNGNTVIQMPITRAENIENVMSIEQGGTGAENVAEARSNLGLETAVTDASISGKEITLTFADGTTETLTTQDTIYSLPTASASALGGVKVGDGLEISSGVLSVGTVSQAAAAYKLPYATSSTGIGVAARVATITNGVEFKLEAGAMVAVKFTSYLSDDWGYETKDTLNVNSTGAKTVRSYHHSESGVGSHTNNFYVFIYDGTYWNMVSYFSSPSYNN